MSEERKKKLWKTVFGWVLGIVLFCLVVFLWKPRCFILQCTGYYCPACGGQRMVWELLKGNFAVSFRHNPFLFVFCPLFLVYLIWEGVLSLREKPPLSKSRAFLPAAAVVLLAMAAFTVLRNLPGIDFLGP